MSEHYRYRKDKTNLSSTFKLPVDDYHYLKVYIWDNEEGMYNNILVSGDPQWESGNYMACFLGMSCTEVDGQTFIPKFFGEIHLVLNKFGVGIVAHELTHFLLNWLREHLDSDDEKICLLIGNMNKKFWNAFYRRYQLVDGAWE